MNENQKRLAALLLSGTMVVSNLATPAMAAELSEETGSVAAEEADIANYEMAMSDDAAEEALSDDAAETALSDDAAEEALSDDAAEEALPDDAEAAAAETDDSEAKTATGTYASSDGSQTLTLYDDNTFALVSGAETLYSGTYTKSDSTLTFDDDTTAKIKENNAWYYTGAIELNNYHKTFSFSKTLSEAQVKYTTETVKDDSSVTGYYTTITVKDNGYKNVYAYGAWLACDNTESTDANGIPSYSDKTYTPQEWKNGMYYNDNSAIAMEKQGDVWTLTLPLASSIMAIQCYQNVNPDDLDGVRLDDGNETTVEIPYDAGKQSDSFDWSVAFMCDEAGTVDYTQVCTTKDGTNVKLSIYTPYGYNANDKDTKYPVLYLIPGAGTNYQTWFTGGRANSIFDNLIKAGEVTPTIVVTLDRENASDLVSDVIPYIESNYNAYTDSAHRAVAGSSMGSVATSNLWLDADANGLFSAYGLFSGANKAFFEDDDYEMTEEMDALLNSGAKVLVGGGYTDFNMFQNTDKNSTSMYRLHNWLTKRDVEHGYMVVSGGHTWTAWTQLLQAFATDYLWQEEASSVTVETYTNGDQKLMLDGTNFTLEANGKTYTGTYTAKQVTGGFSSSTQIIPNVDSVKEQLKEVYGWYSTGTLSLAGQKAGPNSANQEVPKTFTADLNLDQAKVEYSYESVKNPDSKTGYSTTITVSDPKHEYENVYAYGMWMASKVDDTSAKTVEPEEWENGMYYSAYGTRAMTYDPDSGCWTLTLDLASANMGLLCYHDVKQSDLKDLSVPDGSTIQIPYDEVKQSKSFDWTLTAKNEQAGTVTTKTIEAADGTEIQLAIYTPYGYDPDDTSVNYPVVYLIPGMQTQYNTWFTGGYADRIFDNLIANETIAPTIVVTMTRDVAKMDYNDVWDSADDRSKQNGDGDGYINYNGESGSGTENMIHSRVVTDVIPYIDANYNTVADAAHRAIAGTSMGGVATTQIWLTDSDLFDYYGFFSGCDMYFKDADDAKAADEYKALKDTYKADYESLLSVIKESMDGVKIVVGGGITDRNAFGGDQNSAGADNLDAWLTENNIDHTYSIVGGGHDWTTWTQLLVQLTDYMAEDDSSWNVEESTAALEVISNDLFGTADTEGFSTLKKYTDSALTVPGDKVSYTGQAVLALTAKDGTAIDPAKIDISGAYVTLDAGDGYSVEDLIFSGASNLTLSKDGQLIYTLNEGDLEWNNYGYPVEEGGLEWSCIGGNGNGEYYFNLSVHGVKYDGKDADSISFRAEVYIYGREFSSQSSPNGSSTTSWGAGGYNDLELPVAKEETLGATNTSGDPEWTWVGDDTAGKPILCDTKTDNFYITWPEGLDASGLTEDDVVITLRSQYGDEYVLTPTTGTRLIEENGVEIPNGEFNVFSSAGETQISINLVVWAATPVYNTMTIEVKTDKVSSLARAALDSTISKTYDVASVYTHMVQLGGGLDLSGKTVTCVSVFGIDGIENLTLEDVYTPVQYYYAVTNGERGPKAKELYFLIDNGDKTYTVTTDKSEATFYPADTSSNTQLLGHTIFTTDINGDDGGSINVEYNDETLCFTRKVNYGNAAATNLLDPKAAGLEASAGYILTDNGTYDDHQRWAWLYLNNKGWLAPTEETPSEDNKQETPADDKQETPADDKQETPADDKQETPADDEQETPADDKQETPADDKQETSADDQTTVIGSETTKKPTTNVKTGDVQNPAVWAALALASLSSALGAFFLRKKSK